MLGSNPSAAPGAHTERVGRQHGAPLNLKTFRDEHRCLKPTVASRATVYLSTSAVSFTPNQHRIGVIAEIGADMSVWGSASRLTAWAGLCPGSHESAGKRRKVGVRKGNPHFKRLMIQIATAAVKKNGAHYQYKYQQLAKRRGHKRAIVAIARIILTTIFYMISRGTDYAEVGLPVPRPVNREQEANRFVAKLQLLGFNVSLSLAANG